MEFSRRFVLPALLAFAAALAGAVAGRMIFPHPPSSAAVDFHELLHHDIALDAKQQHAVDALERRYAVQRRALEMQMRADNARLAEAIAAEHADGALVNAAVDRCHHTMGELQKATLAHVFAMRALLRPDQAEPFDRAITRALTSDGR